MIYLSIFITCSDDKTRLVLFIFKLLAIRSRRIRCSGHEFLGRHGGYGSCCCCFCGRRNCSFCCCRWLSSYFPAFFSRCFRLLSLAHVLARDNRHSTKIGATFFLTLREYFHNIALQCLFAVEDNFRRVFFGQFAKDLGRQLFSTSFSVHACRQANVVLKR